MSQEEAIWDYKSVRERTRPVKNAVVGDPSLVKAIRRPKAVRGGCRRGRADPPRSSGSWGRARRRRAERGAGGTDPLPGRPLSPPARSAHDQAALSPLQPTKCTKGPGGKCTPNSKPVHTGSCPICQMPFSLLLIETPRWHVAECLDTPGSTDKECPDGLLCNNTIPKHYKRYSHLLLAESRALSQNDTHSTFCSSFEDQTLVDSADHNNLQSLQSKPSQIKETLTSKNQNALQLLKLPVRKVIDENSNECKLLRKPRKTHFSEKVSKTGRSAQLDRSPSNNLHSKLTRSISQLSTDLTPGVNLDQLFNEATVHNETIELKSSSTHELTFVLASDAESDDNISYSPLCSDDEIPHQNSRPCPRKQLFQGCRRKNENIMFYDFRNLKNLNEKLRCQSSDINDIVTPGGYAQGNDTDSVLLTNNVNISTENRIEYETHVPHPKSVPSTYNWIFLDNGNNKEVNNQSQSDLIRSDLIKLEAEDINSTSLLEPSQMKEEPSHSLLCGVMEDYQVRKEKKGNSRETLLANPQNLSLPLLNTVKMGSPLQSYNGTKSRTKSLELASLSLSERGSINTPKRAAINKELKQTNIGVFFGLEPKIKEEKQCLKNVPQGKTKELFSEVSYTAKRQRQRKRKIDCSIGDETCIGSKEQLQTEPVDEQRRTKRQRRGINTDSKPKQCPFYKKIPGTNFTVDAFRYGVIEDCTAYFLTHFHSDHYGGLTKTFRCPIYCSTITRNLVISKLKVQDQYVVNLPMNTECMVDGVKVVLLDANHCPGAVMLLFQLPNGKTILHTGDFRANSSMERYSHLIGKKIHILYLDTTYCSPEYTFPAQQEAIQFVGNVAFETVTMNPRTLVVCGTYSIGKEKVFLGFASTYEQVSRKV
ncbi:DNA cross-link repair 1A protein isoform X2 [Narcine bancroftii]|uniref:DNA cross-link repair 1A protein isoform X2 n=1 Tax=Narcine bancroftii TaxID=1343680 RepID=UPI003831AD4A